MSPIFRAFKPLIAVAALLLPVAPAIAHPEDDTGAKPAIPPDQLRAFVDEMGRRYDFDRAELTLLLGNARLQQPILDAIARPAESKPWREYRPIFVTESRISEGVAFWQENAEALARAAERYGVDPAVIVAIIGVETRYGRHKGGYRVVDALATLGFNYPPRGEFFRKELEQFLLLAREENLDPLQPLGSYAGAMGRPQFIPSSFRAYAIDFSGDGFRDLWSNNRDAIGSVANYFARHGWQRGEPVALRARPEGDAFRRLIAPSDSPKAARTLGEMRRAGMSLDANLPDDAPAALFELEGAEGAEYWIGLGNFYVITRYNHSVLYALAVHQLSEAIRARRTVARTEGGQGS